MNIVRLLFLLTVATCCARAAILSIDADRVVQKVDRANLLGINIALYNNPDDFAWAMSEGPLRDLNLGYIRLPGGSQSDRYYWNGNGVLENGKADPATFKPPYWQVDWSDYKPGFTVDNYDWGKVDARIVQIDAKTMHEITEKHPRANALVTVNAGTGTPEMAAEWVRWANIKNGWGVRYWEIGNELNGEWEAGHIRPDGSKMTAEKYVQIYKQFARAMKAVDPTIKVGGPSCDIDHHEDYFEPLLKLAGDEVDFLSLHFYSLRDSLASESKLFDGLENLKPFTDRLDALVEKYQPQRIDEIEYAITEWNSKLPKDQDAYRLFNGLWFSAWIGEMMACGVDLATVWDMFSGADNGHGILVRQGNTYVPTGRYWAFWLWSHCMGDTLVASSINDDRLHVHATRKDDTLSIMVMNESRTASVPVELDLNGIEGANGTETTLSSREYFRNPVTGTSEWNSGPSTKPWAVTNRITIPPYCVKVFRLGATVPAVCNDAEGRVEPALDLVLPKAGFGDLEMEGWVRAVNRGSRDPFAEDLGSVVLTASGGATVEQVESELQGATAAFILKPNGSDKVTVTATCDGLKTKAVVDFKPVEYNEHIAWTFDTMPAQSESRLTPVLKNGALNIVFDKEAVAPPNNHIFAIKEYPRSVPRERIGGVVFDLTVSKNFHPMECVMQVVLQSHGAYWIPCSEVSLFPGQQQTVRLEISNKKFLNVMDQGFSVLFLLASGEPVSGTLEMDNLGFLLRPEED